MSVAPDSCSTAPGPHGGDDAGDRQLSGGEGNRATSPREDRGIRERNDELAFEGWRKGARQGNMCAQSRLGLMYFKGRGAPRQSDELAVEWWTKAARQGHASSQYNLGRMYEQGRGVNEQSIELAIEWWTKAALQGHVHAQRNLGRIYDRL